MGRKARHGRPKGNGTSTLLKYIAGGRVDRRLRPARAVDAWAEALAKQLGAKAWANLPASQRMQALAAAGMFVLAAALLAEYVREGDLGLYERFSAAVGNVRRLLQALGLDPSAGEDLGDLERALRAGSGGKA